jgi:hypothetical protein
VFGKYPSINQFKSEHKGKIGHWFEKEMGVKHNADGNADLFGWELKAEGKKMSWGDWSAPYRIFCDKRLGFTASTIKENQKEFISIFGVYRPDGEYFSMSGGHVTKYIDVRTENGMILKLDQNKDVSIYYDYSLDKRRNKADQVPNNLQKDNLLIMRWHGKEESFEKYKSFVIDNKLPIKAQFKGKNRLVSLEERVKRKFNVHGIATGLYRQKNHFYGLKFTRPVSFDDWVSYFINKDIYYDPALTGKNPRPYNQWRSNKSFMDSLVEEVYLSKTKDSQLDF